MTQIKMYRIVKRDLKCDNGMDILFFVSFLVITVLPLSHASLHNLEKRSADGHIAPEDCEKKIMESESKDAECYRIEKDKIVIIAGFYCNPYSIKLICCSTQ